METVQGTLKSLLQHQSLKASILRRSAFFTVQLSHPYMTTGKTILDIYIFVHVQTRVVAVQLLSHVQLFGPHGLQRIWKDPLDTG